MKKSIIGYFFSLTFVLVLGIVSFLAPLSAVQAAGSATISWTPPTTDEGGGNLTGLAGYKIYYDTSSRWASNTSIPCPVAGTVVDVPGGNTTNYFFNNILTPGTTYYFTVVAYDNANPPNISRCGRTSGGATEVSKLVTYSGDLNNDRAVNVFDFNILKQNYGTANTTADINKDGTVNISDFNILRGDYGRRF